MARNLRGEVEWEFGEDGNFQLSGRIVQTLTAHLRRGETNEAVELYESCAGSVGAELLSEFSTASSRMQKSIANLFYRARDYKRAATACEQLGEWEAAARSYEAAYAYPKAAACYVRAKNIKKAASVYQKAGLYDKAAELFGRAGDTGSAAQARAAQGDLLESARLFVQQGNGRAAARVLTQIPATDPRFTEAALLMAQILEQMGHPQVALQRLAAALPANGHLANVGQAEIAYQIGIRLEQRGQEASRFWAMIRAFDPAYKDVAQRSGGSTPIVASMPPTFGSRAATPASPPADEDMFAALDRNPLAGNRERFNRPSRPLSGLDVVTRMEDYDLLKTLPIFEQLSLDEMRDFYNLCETVEFAAGDVVIEQGEPGRALLIVREGALEVSRVDGGVAVPVATIEAGQYVGEMSLIDDAPTSARVTAKSAVRAFRISRDPFRNYLFNHDLVALRIYQTFTKTLIKRLRETNERLGR